MTISRFFFILFAFYNVGGARSPLTGVRAAELNAGNENIHGYRYIIEIKWDLILL